tara:strand:+ start:87084 stop:88502 length:1419 start_codon:yes stop_codon:yes gene_type:complete
MGLLNHLSNLKGLLYLHSKDVSRLHRIFDVLIITSSFYFFNGNQISGDNLLFRIVSQSFILTFFLPLAGIYKSFRKRSLVNLSGRIFISWLIVLFLFNSFNNLRFTNKLYFSEILSSWSIFSLFILFLSHVLLRLLLRKYRGKGGNVRNIIFWGMTNEFKSLVKNIEDHPWLGYKIIGWFSPEKNMKKNIDPNLLSLFKGDLNCLCEWFKNNNCDEIIFSDVDEKLVPMQEVLIIFGDTTFPVSYLPKWTLNNMNLRVNRIGDKFHINLWTNYQSLFDKQLKRFFDFIISIFAIIILSPVFVIVALLVKLGSPGPIIFKQSRYGLDGKKFLIYKFRSMNRDYRNEKKVIQAKKEDPRITSVGKFIRKWSIDELPQLFNVVEGSMSLVGPRPHALIHNEEYRRIIPGYMQRCSLKPGITGLAQVNGLRGETPNVKDMEKRIEADLRYQNEWSLKLDLKIIIMTILSINSDKAY